MTVQPNLTGRAAAERRQHNQRMVHADFDQAPFTIAWEVTRACAYACVHCRADAQHRRDPGELSTAEARMLIEQLAGFGNNPILIFTGGDPLMRPDVFELIEFASQNGLRCSLTPTATALPTHERLELARRAGIRRLALSLDAPRPEIHDDFRQVKGSWQRTMDILHRAHAVGLSVQVNTTVAKHNSDILPEMVPFIRQVEAVQWSLFFLVPTGRAMVEQMVSAERHEQLFNWLYDLAQVAPFDIKATAAPMYRRVAIERKRAQDGGKPVTFQSAGFQYGDGLNRPTKGVNDGNGFMFISHIGQIQPSGFLPITAGDVRRDDVVQVYRQAQLFKDLRNPDRYKGVCGTCEFRQVCGGQRGRAYALTGDYLESDPACIRVSSHGRPAGSRGRP
jgi:AdoMet-dependent heme synthase